MRVCKGAPTTFVFWPGRNVADAEGEAIAGRATKHSICSFFMMRACHELTGGDAR